MSLDVDAARKASRSRSATSSGIDVSAAAWGIFEVVTAQMPRPRASVLGGCGKDPRQFAIIPFGGRAYPAPRIARTWAAAHRFPTARACNPLSAPDGDLRFDWRARCRRSNEDKMAQVERTSPAGRKDAARSRRGPGGGDPRPSRSADMRSSARAMR